MSLLMLVGVALRAFRIGHQSLWTDEVLTPYSSSGSLWRVLNQKEVNTNIPQLYYVVVHFFLPLGFSEWVLRLPSVLFGAASIPLVYFVVRDWLGWRTALVSAALLCISPLHVWYSQEARPYALFLFLSLLALRLFQLLLEQPDNRWRQSGFVLATASVFYTHTLGAPFIGFLAACFVLLTPRSTWRHWIPLFAAIAVLLIPAVYRLVTFAPGASADTNRALGIAFIPYAMWAFATGYSIGPTLTQLHLSTRAAIALQYIPIVLPVALIVAWLALLGVASLWKNSPKVFWTIALWFSFPLAFALAGTLVTWHPFNVRYIVLGLPAFLVVLATGLLALEPIPLRLAAAAALVVISAFSLGNYYFVSRYAREDNRAAGHFLASHADAGDFVIADAPYTALNLEYYARRADVSIVGFPRATDASPGEVAVLRSRGKEPGIRARSDTSTLAGLIGSRGRFWLFLSRSYHGVPADEVLAFCDSRYRRLRQFATDNDVLLIQYAVRR